MNVVVLDIDGVVREFKTDMADDIIEEQLDLPAGTVSKAAFEGPELVEAVTGRITFEQWTNSIVQKLTVLTSDRDRVTAVFQIWIDYRGHLIPETIDLIDRLNHLGIPVFAFTNGTSRILAEIIHHNLKEKFRKVLNSADIGFKKPDSRAFSAAHREIEANLGTVIDPASVTFVDDRAANVVAAEEFGWQGIIFSSVEDLPKILPSVPTDASSGLPHA